MAATEPEGFAFKQLHGKGMLIFWIFAMDIAILIVHYRYVPMVKWVHGGIGLFTLLLMIASTVEYISHGGFDQWAHRPRGLAIEITSLIQVILGIIIVWMISNGKPYSQRIVKIVHRLLGLGLWLVTRYQVIKVLFRHHKDGLAYFVMLWQIIVLCFYLYRFFKQKTLTQGDQHRPIPSQKVKDLSQLPWQKSYAVYGNSVYDLQRVKENHPGTKAIIDPLKNDYLDKYLYGMYGPEIDLRVSSHSHSSDSIELLGNPVAELDIEDVYSGLKAMAPTSVKVNSIKIVGPNIYQVGLVSMEHTSLECQGYSSVHQLGRCFAVNFDSKFTRLYTTEAFLSKSNVQLLNRVYFGPRNIAVSSQHSFMLDSINSTNVFELPLLIKRYDDGAATHSIESWGNQVLNISCQRGPGLAFSTLAPGKVIICVGGTGLYPFNDLIDLLFKAQLLREGNQSVNQLLLDANPILRSQPFDSFTFQVMGSFSRLSQIHPITLSQISYLTRHSTSFSFTLRVSGQHLTQETTSSLGIPLTNDSFINRIIPRVSDYEVSHTYVCGPPRMNSAMREALAPRLNPSKYTIL